MTAICTFDVSLSSLDGSGASPHTCGHHQPHQRAEVLVRPNGASEDQVS
jgi:hypothetical protein